MTEGAIIAMIVVALIISMMIVLLIFLVYCLYAGTDTYEIRHERKMLKKEIANLELKYELESRKVLEEANQILKHRL